MKMPRSFLTLVALVMSLMISNIPHIAMAEVAQGMIPTSAVVEEMSRAQARARVQSYLDRADLQQALKKQGIPLHEVEARVASLSDHELRDLATQMDKAQYGGDVGGVLIVVLLVVLIIFLIKRI